MEERLLLLLESEQLSSSKFADVISVQRSSVSHILSGRNKPSFDFIQKTLKAFPALSADWLILGKGNMYEGTVSSAAAGLFNQDEQGQNKNIGESQHQAESGSLKSDDNDPNPANISLQERYRSEKEQSPDTNILENSKRISRVILFYDDNSFSTYEPES